MQVQGNLIKMQSHFNNEVVAYTLPIGGKVVEMNPLIGKEIHLRYENRINCIKCGKITKKSFNQGFCYSCFLKAPEADPAIIRPELDQAHLGISRDMEWAKTYSLVPHNVYLAVSSGLKVGVTRAEQVLTRWIDQGAWKAVKLAETPYRQLAGEIEVSLKEHLADKTNWRHMLTNQLDEDVDLLEEKYRVRELIPESLQEYVTEDDEITELKYPVEKYPAKVKSLNFDKIDTYQGVLSGIKGQYLIFEDGSVMNVRKYNGYFFIIES